ncbi:hypothetical protein CRUP_010768, partial [Coryphaenoides rupestris]
PRGDTGHEGGVAERLQEAGQRPLAGGSGGRPECLLALLGAEGGLLRSHGLCCAHRRIGPVHSEHGGRAGGAGCAGGGRLLHGSHAVQRPQRTERRRGGPDTRRAPAVREEDRHTTGPVAWALDAVPSLRGREVQVE